MINIHLNQMLSNLNQEIENMQNNDNDFCYKKLLNLFETMYNIEDTEDQDYSLVFYSLLSFYNLLERKFDHIGAKNDLKYIVELMDMINQLHFDLIGDGCIYFVKVERTMKFLFKNGVEVKVNFYCFADKENYFLSDNTILEEFKKYDSNSMLDKTTYKIQKTVVDLDKFISIMKEVLNNDNWDKRKKFPMEKDNEKTCFVFNEDKAFNKYFENKGLKHD